LNFNLKIHISYFDYAMSRFVMWIIWFPGFFSCFFGVLSRDLSLVISDCLERLVSLEEMTCYMSSGT